MISSKDSLICHHGTLIGHKTAWLNVLLKVEEWREEGCESKLLYNHYLSKGREQENE